MRGAPERVRTAARRHRGRPRHPTPRPAVARAGGSVRGKPRCRALLSPDRTAVGSAKACCARTGAVWTRPSGRLNWRGTSKGSRSFPNIFRSTAATSPSQSRAQLRRWQRPGAAATAFRLLRRCRDAGGRHGTGDGIRSPAAPSDRTIRSRWCRGAATITSSSPRSTSSGASARASARLSPRFEPVPPYARSRSSTRDTYCAVYASSSADRPNAYVSAIALIRSRTSRPDAPVLLSRGDRAGAGAWPTTAPRARARRSSTTTRNSRS